VIYIRCDSCKQDLGPMHQNNWMLLSINFDGKTSEIVHCCLDCAAKAKYWINAFRDIESNDAVR